MRAYAPGEIDAGLSQEILAAVSDKFDSQLEFTMDLMRHASLRGQEAGAQASLYAALQARGYAMDRWSIDIDAIQDHPGFSPVKVDYTNALNVVASHRPRSNQGRSLILNGHIDVVPTGPLEM